MPDEHPRITRERKTLQVMIEIYCRGQHGSKDALCPRCQELWDYAEKRLDKCPFQENKTTCAKCPIHCYKSDRREEIKAVMRYAGPHMPYRHPVLTLFHYLDGWRKEPVRARSKNEKT
jgi:hypothetical protein